MKKTIFIIPLIIAGAFFIGCGDSKDDDKTLGFINSNDSDGAINDIVWAGDEVNKWTKTDGYAQGESTESKAVTVTTGTVACFVNDGSSFVNADVKFPDASGTESLSLADGANIFTLKATTGSASVTKK